MEVTRWWWIFGWIQVLVLLIATLWPAVELPGVEGTDKLVHVASFGWLMIWFAQIVQQRWRLAMLLIAYGGLIELLQWGSGYRHGDWLDLMADSAGVVLAWVAVAWVLPDLLAIFLKSKPGN